MTRREQEDLFLAVGIVLIGGALFAIALVYFIE